jgi:hypothetical protein
MAVSFLLASADSGLQFQIKEALGTAARVDLVAVNAEAAIRNDILAASSEAILILDAQIPRAANLPPDREEKAALWLLQELRGRGIRLPALVITSRPLGITELDEYCTPENQAIALPQRRLQSSVVQGFMDMLLLPPGAPKPTWDVIELDVKRTSIKCFIGNRNGTMIDWAETSTRSYSAVHRLSIAYAKPDFTTMAPFYFEN